MRIKTIYDVEQRLESPMTSYEEHRFLYKLKSVYELRLEEILNLSKLRFHFDISCFGKGKDKLLAENVTQLETYQLYKFYTLILCYYPDCARNVFRTTLARFDSDRNRKPDFGMIREFCRSYYYFQDYKIMSRIVGDVPKKVLEHHDWEYLNKYLCLFIRPSLEYEGKYSHIPDAEHRAKDIQVATTIGRIAKRFVPPETQRYLCDKLLGTDTKLFVAETDEEISKVYTKGPRACMAVNNFVAENGKEVNVAVVYNTDDVGIIYGMRGTSITGRAVFNRKTKHYVRAYGDSYFEEALKEAGYRHSSSALNECHLALRHKVDEPEKIFIPYLDGSVQRVSVGEDFLLVHHEGDIEATSTAGIYSWDHEAFESGSPCDHCGDLSEELDEVIGGGEWCENCRENETIEVHDGFCWVIVSNDHIDLMEMPSGEWALGSQGARALGFVEDIDGDWQDKDDVYPFEGDYFTEAQLDREGLIINEHGEVVRDDEDDEEVA